MDRRRRRVGGKKKHTKLKNTSKLKSRTKIILAQVLLPVSRWWAVSFCWFIYFFPHCVGNVGFYSTCSCENCCLVRALKKGGWGEITCTLWIKQKVSWLWHALRHYITTQPFLLALRWYRRVSGMHHSRYFRLLQLPIKLQPSLCWRLCTK